MTLRIAFITLSNLAGACRAARRRLPGGYIHPATRRAQRVARLLGLAAIVYFCNEPWPLRLSRNEAGIRG
jgi:hypothetical protein